MIKPRYRIASSRIAGAGQGLYLDEAVTAGSVVIAPDAIDRTWSFADVLARTDAADALAACVRWFEDRFTVSLDWPDECYVNHSFAPSGLWHLGFVFAARDLAAGTEVTVDYRHLLAEGQVEDFADAESGRPIVGLSWAESLRETTLALAALVR
ncbi:SET domain-containing protein [Coralloluteibacterium stylophorae]|uniref:SET domain-containing protein-lysine N-methyltransferase n=1 Tax=Coralloluteibacterium stylophorae TaxID=1776034 RepID=A0A8J7VRV8_9GAMM|nr:SET domain-containing protein [Coralloluteibacterium stylophorae]MBS7456719.1 hypothetical protein [Coralloluteibacterium stylophorae]